MNRIVRWLRVGGAVVMAVVSIAATYFGLSFWTYGSQTHRGPDLPEWFTAGFDYAVDKTPWRESFLHVADWMGLRDWHEALSANRRVKAWFVRRGIGKSDDPWPSCQSLAFLVDGMDAYYASCEASFFPSLVPITNPTAKVKDPYPLDFGKDWEEFNARCAVSQAERRCQESSCQCPPSI